MILNKKGQSLDDGIFMVVFLLFLAIAGGIVAYFMPTVYNNMRAIPAINQSQPALDAMEKAEAINSKWDYLIVAVLVGFAIAVIITGYFIPVSSLFMVLYILGLLIGVPVAVIMQYVFEQFSGTALLSSTFTTSFPITTVIFSHLPLFYICVSVLGFVATYAKGGQGER